MSQDAMQVVFDHVYARRRGDLDGIAATLAPDVIHEGVRPGMVCRNRTQVLRLVEHTLEAGGAGIERVEILDAGPDQAVLGVAGPRFLGVEMASPAGEVYILFTVQAGRIVRMRDFRSRDAALAAAGSPVSA